MQANVSSRLDLGEQLAALSPAQRKLLELRLMKKNRSAAKQTAIAHDPDRKTAPLSFSQQGLWVLNQLMDGETLYHMPTAERLIGTLDIPALRRALQAIVDRHKALRTNFKIVDGTPQQFAEVSNAVRDAIDKAQAASSAAESSVASAGTGGGPGSDTGRREDGKPIPCRGAGTTLN